SDPKLGAATFSLVLGGRVAGAPGAAAAPRPAAVAAAAAATPTPAAFSLRPGLVDRQGAAVDLRPVEGGDRGLRLLVALHLDEAEPLGSAGVAVHDHLGRHDGAVRLEDLGQVAVAHLVAEVADVQFLRHPFHSRKPGPHAPGSARSQEQTTLRNPATAGLSGD